MDKKTLKNIELIKNYIFSNYKNNLREPAEKLPYRFLVPGAAYAQQLWDWDSWLTGIALMEIDAKGTEEYQKGCILDFLSNMDEEGRMPILVTNKPYPIFELSNKETNIHKPCLAQHALEISKKYGGAKWLESYFDKFLLFISYYEKHQKDEESGLFFWIDDFAIGFDNDPTVFYRQNKSSGAIYLNCLMYKELVAIKELAAMLNKKDVEKAFEEKIKQLKQAINNECFDNVDGFYYSVDLSLEKIDPDEWLHQGCRRFWHSLPIKIKTWASMLPLWCGIASKEQAEQAVKVYMDEDGLRSKYGIRSVSKKEKMFRNMKSGNPSCWLGPIWISANYLTYLGLKNYGYDDLAKEIAIKTINLLGDDIAKCGEFHEYYDSETGEGLLNQGFQSWNFLVFNLIKELEK